MTCVFNSLFHVRAKYYILFPWLVCFVLYRSFPQLRATFEEYQKLTTKDIEESIESEMSGDLKKAMIIIGKSTLYLYNNSKHYSKNM